MIPVIERLESHTEQVGDCIMWTGSTRRQGKYGKIKVWGKEGWKDELVHRVAWETRHGRLDAGITIDHLCRQTLCINVDHMEPVTITENLRRRGVAQTRCRRGGHPLEGENLLPRKNGKRDCRECARARQRKKVA